MMDISKIKPKLLKPERVVEIFMIYNLCGEIFEGSPLLELFEHIAMLTMLVKQDNQLVDSVL